MNKSSRLIIHLPFIFAGALLLCCGKKTSEMKIISNDSPKYSDTEYIALRLINTIDITDINVIYQYEHVPDYGRIIQFDKNNNMYILDRNDSFIAVFDPQGNEMRRFGRAGQGPGEFIHSHLMIVNDGKIYVFSRLGYQIMDTHGEYITSQHRPMFNPLKKKIIGDQFYIFEGVVDRTFTQLEFHVTVRNKQYAILRTIFKQKYPHAFTGGPHYNFMWHNWILITEKGDFYFPSDNFAEYNIVKYDKMGQPLMAFSRKYRIERYTAESKNMYDQRQGGSKESTFPQSPPVVRMMIQDSRENIWIVAGETVEDNLIPDFENTIDLFDKNGVWLYTFKSAILSRNWVYNNGKIYVVRMDEQTLYQYIDVYEIKYARK